MIEWFELAAVAVALAAVTVLIRTFLSVSLSVQLHGPWSRQAPTPSTTTAGD